MEFYVRFKASNITKGNGSIYKADTGPADIFIITD